MARHDVPTARFAVSASLAGALTTVRGGEFGWPVVIKADGLAAGKGVVIAQDLAEAESAITASMQDLRFGAAGAHVVIEECLTGPEVSYFVLSDGSNGLPIGTAQDHKRIFDEDRGPNTGGMGAFAPSPLITDDLEREIIWLIVGPVIAGMAAVRATPFRGFLCGLMLTADGPRVIEFNVRLGDPETQVVLPLIDEPLLPLLVAAASGSLVRATCRPRQIGWLGWSLASRGYPDSAESGRAISESRTRSASRR
jgi:phosphoribosylamine--glycine ligase